MLRKLWSLLVVLIASSLMVNATVHAREIPGAVLIECSGNVHNDGDADQSQGDADKAVPHHHGTCLGSSLDLPATEALSLVARPVALRPVAIPDRKLPSNLVDPALRPPTA